jgi:hypothetical protein
MEAQTDFKDMFELLNRHKAQFIIVGAYALAFHGVPRNTGDIDVYVNPTAANARSILAALKDFGFGSLGLTEIDFTRMGNVIQLGTPPVRIDFLNSLSGVSWKEANGGKIGANYGGVQIHYLGRAQLVANKRETARKKDLADLEAMGES